MISFLRDQRVVCALDVCPVQVGHWCRFLSFGVFSFSCTVLEAVFRLLFFFCLVSPPHDPLSLLSWTPGMHIPHFLPFLPAAAHHTLSGSIYPSMGATCLSLALAQCVLWVKSCKRIIINLRSIVVLHLRLGLNADSTVMARMRGGRNIVMNRPTAFCLDLWRGQALGALRKGGTPCVLQLFWRVQAKYAGLAQRQNFHRVIPGVFRVLCPYFGDLARYIQMLWLLGSLHTTSFCILLLHRTTGWMCCPDDLANYRSWIRGNFSTTTCSPAAAQDRAVCVACIDPLMGSNAQGVLVSMTSVICRETYDIYLLSIVGVSIFDPGALFLD